MIFEPYTTIISNMNVLYRNLNVIKYLDELLVPIAISIFGVPLLLCLTVELLNHQLHKLFH